jgi:hypothetical protein
MAPSVARAQQKTMPVVGALVPGRQDDVKRPVRTPARSLAIQVPISRGSPGRHGRG